MVKPTSFRAWLLAAASILPAWASAQAINYAGPLVITQGGTYSGNYQSLDSRVPCILVNTTAPVVLLGCKLSGAGHLIQSGTGANLTVRECSGVGLAPSVDGQPPGHFLDSYQSQSLVVEHNSFSGTSGIVVNRWAGNSGALTVRYNQVRNVDGRWRNNGGSSRCSFLQLNTVSNLAGVEIAFNEVINTPNQSLVEDNINFYNASGTAGSPIRVHDNFVRGAYPYPATAGTFTGTGLTTDGDASLLGTAAGYIEASANQFVSTCNAAMNIAAGHDVYYHDNRIVTSGMLPDGTHLSTTYAGTAVFNYYNQLASVFFNNRIVNNTIGYVRWGSTNPYPDRQDLSPGACATCTGTTSLPNPITLATEDNEYALWQQKLAQNGVTVGPTGAAAPASRPAATTPGSIVNPGFEADNTPVGAPAGWQTTTGQGTNDNADYTEAYGGAHSGTYHGTHYRPEAYEVYTYQVVTGLANGTYTLSAWVKSSGGQSLTQLKASNFGSNALTTGIAAAPDNWVQVSVPNISVSNGQCEIGVYSNAGAGQWLYFDDFTLTKTAANVPPRVTLTASAASLTLGQALLLSAAAADSDGTIAKVEFFAGTTKLGEDGVAPYQLSWTPTATGTYALTAVATDNTGTATTSAATTVTVAAAPAPTPPASASGNLVVNPGFEADNAPVDAPTGWQTTTGPGTNDNADYTEAFPGAHNGLYHGTQFRPEPYQVYTYQVISNLPTGTYSLSAWMKSSGGQSLAQLQARNFGGNALTADVAATPDGQWVLITIPNIAVSSGQCEIGFYSQAGSGQWLYFDDVQLVAQNGNASPTPPPTTGPTLFPNPADSQVTVDASFPRADLAVISFIDAQGNLAGRHWRTVTPGDNQLSVYIAYLPSGLYTVSITSNSDSSQPPIKLRLEVRH
ncbi:Ig-like domain-containing protein [Hymenobacter psoromatis]|uniref:Ig-like domain-containing protein n=1 Tax=Hymenobacter psoromatis TaxID=1484116 RepID=UPI001CBF0B3B|nr:Ig-like domain-containing protein [Hymenobacter psoromatis]